jgi:hypothetical protein
LYALICALDSLSKASRGEERSRMNSNIGSHHCTTT